MTPSDIEPIADLGSLPFHVGESETPSNADLPDVLPFVVAVRRDFGLLVQASNSKVQEYLDVAYRRGSIIGTPMSGQGIGRHYADDFLDFIIRALSPESVRDRHVLEIGCGTGYLLHRLKELGADVLGIEPGQQGQEAAKKYGIRIIRGMFPNENLGPNARFDLIVTYGVLEHVTDPVHFLELQAQDLNESGLLIFSIPDCTEYIRLGDISMFAHEHWSYFSPGSVAGLLKVIGLRLLRLERSGYGGALYVVAGKSGEPIHFEIEDEQGKLFAERMNKAIQCAGQYFDDAARSKPSIGIFCPGRAINLLHILHQNQSIRFFDDDMRLWGKYYPPFTIPVESRESLMSKPVDQLVIMSRSFGSKLKHELQNEKKLSSTSIVLADEFLGNC